MRPLHIIRNICQVLPLLRNDLRNLLEQHIQIPNALLDVSDLLLALGNQRILEVNLVLWGEPQLLLLLDLLEVVGGLAGAAFLVVGGCAGGGYGGALFLEGLALEGLEFIEGGLEVAEELLLFVFLCGLYDLILATSSTVAIMVLVVVPSHLPTSGSS